MLELLLVLRVTRGKLDDLEDGLNVCMSERLNSYRRWLRGGSRFEAALALRGHRRAAWLYRSIGKRAVPEGAP